MALKEAAEKAGILAKPVIYMPEEGFGAQVVVVDL